MPTETESTVDTITKVDQDDGEQVPVANDGTYSDTVSDAAIDAQGTLIELDTRGKRVLDLSLSASEGAGYVLEASPDGETWFGPFDNWSGIDQINQTYRLGARYIRLRISDSASDGATATGFMEAS